MDNESQQETFKGEPTQPAKRRKKGIYILPNLFTLAALFGGFYAIVMAMNARYEMAAIGIFCSMVLDSLDGRVARMTGTASEFGEQFDSLSDMASFGVAPALVVYTWALIPLGKLGWTAAFVYCACGALRLARFNTNIGIVDKRFFQGLPSPAAAGIVAGLVWFMTFIGIVGTNISWLAFVLTLFAGLSMVTNVPFYSFKDINFRKSVPFIVLVAIALAFALVMSNTALILFVIFMVYGFSGYVVYFMRYYKGDKLDFIQKRVDPDEIPMEKPETQEEKKKL